MQKNGTDCNAIQRPTSSDMDNTDRAETVQPWLTKQKSREIFRFTASTVDIPTRWNPRAKQQPTGLIACGAMRRRPVRAPSIAQTKKKNQHTMCTGFFFGASSDTELFKNHRSTICFQGHRIATCLYRTPMGGCIEKQLPFIYHTT